MKRPAPSAADVFDPRQPLLDESIQAGRDLPLLLGGFHRQLSQAHQQRQDREHVDRDGETHPVVLEPAHHQHSDEEHAGSGQADQEPGDEIGDGGDVPVDPLDHLARRGVVVKTHVEGQQVLAEFLAQPVGGPPPDVRSQIGGPGVEHLVDDPRNEVGHPDGDHARDGVFGDGGSR